MTNGEAEDVRGERFVRDELRRGLRVSLIGLLLTAGLAAALKAAGWMPPHVTWLVALFAAAPFGLLAVTFAAAISRLRP